jgi:hypothetical protein
MQKEIHIGRWDNFIKYISNQNWYKQEPTGPQHTGIPLLCFSYSHPFKTYFKGFQTNSTTKVLSRYMTHFSAFTRISDFIQQHSISMKISTITRMDRISRDVILFKQQYDARTIPLKNMGTVNWDRTRNINTQHETRRILLQCPSFNHERISEATDCRQRPKCGTMKKYGQMKSRWTNGKGLTRWRSMGISLPDLLKMGENT